MAGAAVDTTVLIAAADIDDSAHGDASKIVSGMDRGDLPTGRVTNYVILETLNWMHARNKHEKAVHFYKRLNASAGFEIVHCAQKDFTHALELFETYGDLSFGDATIAAHMLREGIEYVYSLDDDFDGVDGINRLNTNENPFT